MAATRPLDLSGAAYPAYWAQLISEDGTRTEEQPPRGAAHSQSRMKSCKCPGNNWMSSVGVVAAIALLVIAALGLSGHASAMTVGATLVGVGAGCPLLGYLIQKGKGKSADGWKTVFVAAIALGVGISAMRGGVSLRAVSAIGVTGASLYLGSKLRALGSHLKMPSSSGTPMTAGGTPMTSGQRPWLYDDRTPMTSGQTPRHLTAGGTPMTAGQTPRSYYPASTATLLETTVQERSWGTSTEVVESDDPDA